MAALIFELVVNLRIAVIYMVKVMAFVAEAAHELKMLNVVVKKMA